jgi:hypothetical protein
MVFGNKLDISSQVELHRVEEKLRDWKAALTRFTIQFEGRMPKD